LFDQLIEETKKAKQQYLTKFQAKLQVKREEKAHQKEKIEKEIK